MFSAFTDLISGVAGKIAVGLILALLVVCGIFYYLWDSSQSTIIDLNSKVSSLVTEKKTLEDTVDKLNKSNRVDEQVQSDNVKEKIVYKDKLVENKAATDQKVKAVEDKYKQLEDTAANIQAKQIEISTIRITDMWTNYCLTAASSPQCVVKEQK